MEWVNPHAWVHFDVKKPDGTVEAWKVEGGTPNTLLRRGLRKTDLPAGAVITVDGYRAKDGGTRMSGRNIVFADGRELFLGSSGPGRSTTRGKDSITAVSTSGDEENSVRRRKLTAVVVAVGLIAAAQRPVQSQGGPIPRTSWDKKPDLNGTWQVAEHGQLGPRRA